MIEKLRRIYKYFSGSGLDRTLQAQARTVREQVQALHLITNVYPDILLYAEKCSVCGKFTMMLVRNGDFCFECFQNVIRLARDEAESGLKEDE